ncbi:MAG: flagellar biosynthesis anti-sigma factor FlgM [Dehalococcoidia bacterium]|jgi:hypothetical protein|nr:flagellar biosynthesis anti-sigma factor FlgM [Dehalococcoidia bacterium]
MADTTHTPDGNPANDPVPFDDRTRRVMELRKQVREGTYQRDPAEVARAILREWIANGDALGTNVAVPVVETAPQRHAAAGRFLVASGEANAEPDEARSA